MTYFIKKLGKKICEPFKWIYRTVRNFLRKLKRSTKWFIRMWNNYDWEGEYLIDVMVYKMKDIRYQLEVLDRDFVDLRHQPIIEHGKTVGTEDHLAGLDKAIELGERILKDEYYSETRSPEVQKWFDEHGFCSIGREKMPDDIREKWLEEGKTATENERKDKDEFFKTVRDNFGMWWS